MTRVAWDEVGERGFETGVSHGVLYPLAAPGVPWNGLTAVTELRGGEIKGFYQDGIPYLIHQVPSSYAAKLSAFTYPDELDALTGGIELMAEGMQSHDQRGALPFGLSYRTRLGNDLEGVEHGYKIHLLYNVIAVPSDFVYGTIDAGSNISALEWDLKAIPPTDWALGRPTAHISIDSRRVNPTLLAAIEDILYGTDEADPDLPNQLVLNGLAMEMV